MSAPQITAGKEFQEQHMEIYLYNFSESKREISTNPISYFLLKKHIFLIKYGIIILLSNKLFQVNLLVSCIVQ